MMIVMMIQGDGYGSYDGDVGDYDEDFLFKSVEILIGGIRIRFQVDLHFFHV